jgi:hypothetical protein
MREKIETYKLLITEELIRVDLENKKENKQEYLKMTRVDYLKRLLKLLKMVEE